MPPSPLWGPIWFCFSWKIIVTEINNKPNNSKTKFIILITVNSCENSCVWYGGIRFTNSSTYQQFVAIITQPTKNKWLHAPWSCCASCRFWGQTCEKGLVEKAKQVEGRRQEWIRAGKIKLVILETLCVTREREVFWNKTENVVPPSPKESSHQIWFRSVRWLKKHAMDGWHARPTMGFLHIKFIKAQKPRPNHNFMVWYAIHLRGCGKFLTLVWWLTHWHK